MKHLLLFCLLLLSVPVWAQNLKALDAKNGFRDAVFGTDFAAMTGMEVVEGAGTDNQVARRAGDDLKVGDATLAAISYFFYKGKLSTVMLETKGLVNSRALLETLRAGYGNGFRSNQFMERYRWSGRTVSMSYDENSISRDAMVFITSEAIEKQKLLNEKGAAKKAAAGL